MTVRLMQTRHIFTKIRPGTTYSDCLITVGNTLKYSLKLEGLDIINSGTYDWTVTGQAE